MLVQSSQGSTDCGVEMVLYGVVGASGKQFRNLFPFVSKPGVGFEESSLVL